VRDFIEWGFRTGMRKGEIAKMTWDMLDRGGSPWVLHLPGSITKNKRGRALGLQGEVRAIIERRAKARRLDCPLIFHRVSKGRPGQPMRDIRKVWNKALRDAKLPEGRIFHDLRRSAVRTLIRSGVDPSVAMKVSGHKTRSMLDRYNIIEEQETARALVQADAYLSMQSAERNVVSLAANGEQGQLGDNRTPVTLQTGFAKGVNGGSGWESNARNPTQQGAA
jgi:integrase